VLVACLYLAIRVSLDYQKERDQSATPHLQFVHWNTATVQIRSKETYWHGTTGQLLGQGERRLPNLEVQPLYVHVTNDPPGRRPEAVAADAVIYLTFVEEGAHAPTLEARGRWAENAQMIDLKEGDPTTLVYRRTLPPNGERHKIDITVVFPKTGEMFVSNDEFWSSGVGDAKYRLDGNVYDVRITIRATGLPRDKVAWFTLKRLSNPIKMATS